MRGRWTVKRDLYEWWLKRISDEIKVGHRFYGIMTLEIYAKKCDIDEEELWEDAFGLLQRYDDVSVEDINRFTKDNIVCALEMFNEDYVTFPRDDINGNRDWRNKTGQPSKRGMIFDYMRSYPEVKKKTEIARALQIDRGTVAKYYDEILTELAVDILA